LVSFIMNVVKWLLQCGRNTAAAYLFSCTCSDHVIMPNCGIHCRCGINLLRYAPRIMLSIIKKCRNIFGHLRWISFSIVLSPLTYFIVYFLCLTVRYLKYYLIFHSFDIQHSTLRSFQCQPNIYWSQIWSFNLHKKWPSWWKVLQYDRIRP